MKPTTQQPTVLSNLPRTVIAECPQTQEFCVFETFDFTQDAEAATLASVPKLQRKDRNYSG